MARILIAASPEPRRILERVLAEHQFTSTGDPGEAAQWLDKVAFDLIVCTVMFNNYRMFDFLRLVKDREGWEDVPFVCAQVLSSFSTISSAASKTTRFAASQLGAAAFLDIRDYHENPERQLQTAIESCLEKEWN